MLVKQVKSDGVFVFFYHGFLEELQTLWLGGNYCDFFFNVVNGFRSKLLEVMIQHIILGD